MNGYIIGSMLRPAGNALCVLLPDDRPPEFRQMVVKRRLHARKNRRKKFLYRISISVPQASAFQSFWIFTYSGLMNSGQLISPLHLKYSGGECRLTIRANHKLDITGCIVELRTVRIDPFSLPRLSLISRSLRLSAITDTRHEIRAESK